MISKAVCTSAQGAIDYFKNHLNAADYFVTSEKMDRGEFIGKVAERLNISEKAITRNEFVAFVNCDMKALGADSSRPRMSEIKYIEFTYSPPKAVSVVAAVDDRVKGQLYSAVKEELKWFEQQVDVRDRRGNLANEEMTKPTGKMLAALFQHETSRTNDPDFHVHALIGNVTWDQERQKYLAVHYGQMLELRTTLDARIHNNLAARMGNLGYQVETAPSGFGLKEVAPSAVAMFSERGNQVKTVKSLLQLGYTAKQISRNLQGESESEKRRLLTQAELLKERLGGPDGKPVLAMNHKIDQIAVKLTRPEKVRITSKTLREDVGKRLEQSGLKLGQPSPWTIKPTLNLPLAIEQGTKIAFDKESVVRLDKLQGEIVRLAPGQVSNDKMTEQLRDDRQFLIRRMEGHEVVTTRQILGEERTLLHSVTMGFNQREPMVKNYVTPPALVATPARVEEIVKDARARGEQLRPAQAEKWLNQFAAIHRYVCTSKDQFLNIRGGAGTGKTFSLERLVDQSQQGGRPVYLCAPYGEQARVTLREDASRIEAGGRHEVARVFAQANTVDHLLLKAGNDPQPFRGADIYVDEAGLLDTRKALALVRLAERVDARVIFQGDTQQMAAVGRGQPIKLLQDELKLGMHVPRASISRRQLSVEDKKLSKDLSSGKPEKFAAAVQTMMDRGMIRETAPDVAIEKVAREIVDARAVGREVVAVSSVHRISEALSNRVHDLEVERAGRSGQAVLDVHLRRDLQPAELHSSQFYREGDIVEFKRDGEVTRAAVTAVRPDGLLVRAASRPVLFREVRGVFDRSTMERGSGEKVLLQEKIKQGERVFEKGSRQTIAEIKDGMVYFQSGLKLSVDDGRVRQGDCLTDYKAQGIKGVEVRGIEDNRSAVAMANMEVFHVKGTRHVQNVVIHVENKALYLEAIQRSNVKFSALHLERLPVSPVRPEIIESPSVDKGRLLLTAREWGKEFVGRVNLQKMAEQVRQHLSRVAALRPRVAEAIKENPAAKVAVAEKITPSVEEMAQKLREKVRERIIQKQKATPAPAVETKIDWSPVQSPSHRQGRGIGL
jgi:conjugative relaxase-like TrwC/TraI family protein